MRVLTMHLHLSCLLQHSLSALVIDATPSKNDVADPGPQSPVNDAPVSDMSAAISAQQGSRVADHSSKAPRLAPTLPLQRCR